MDAMLKDIGGWAAAQLEACTRCGMCAGACPFYEITHNPEHAPVWKLDLLRRAYDQRISMAGRLRVFLGLERRIDRIDLAHWRDLNFGACSTCNRCSLTCPMGIAVGPLLHELRCRLAASGLIPDALQRVSQTLQRDGNVFGFPSSERAGWVDYMNEAPDDLYQRPQAATVYFVGCVSSFAPRGQHIAEAFVQLLTLAGEDFTILGEGELCCGYPLRAAGLEAQAQAIIAQNIEAVKRSGASTVVFTCPACRLIWMQEYRPRLPGVRLLHATELLAELVQAGRITPGELQATVTYHDPCDLARTGGVYEAPRQVLRAIPGVRLIESRERRESGLCCGGGGDVEMSAPQMTREVAKRTAAKLAAGGASLLATACPQCTRVLEEGIKTVSPGMKVMDISEILARSVQIM